MFSLVATVFISMTGIFLYVWSAFSLAVCLSVTAASVLMLCASGAFSFWLLNTEARCW